LPDTIKSRPQASPEDIQLAIDEFVQSEQRPQVLSLADVRAAITKRLDGLDVDSHLLSVYHADATLYHHTSLDKANVFRDAPWRRSLVATDGNNRAYIPDTPSDLPRFGESAEKLRQLFNTNYDGASAGARQKMDVACDRLALDLALSSRIFVTSEPGVRVKAVDGGDQPASDFQFLRPSKPKSGRKTDDDDDAADAATLMVASDAARHLVSDWKVGEPFPPDYVYTNPYDEADADGDGQSDAFRNRVALGKDISASQPVLPSRQQDHIPDPQATFTRYFAGSVPPQPDPGHIPRVDSAPHQAVPTLTFTQPEAFDPFASSQMSQALPAFSQFVPGAHANRKPAKKKRLGGF
jgi:hypothetical protein